MRESARMCASVRVALVFSSVKVSRRHHQKVFKNIDISLVFQNFLEMRDLFHKPVKYQK